MKEVWIIVKVRQATFGHGDFGTVVEVAQTDAYSSSTPHPAFASEEAAVKYINSLEFAFSLRPYCIQVKE